MTISTELRKAGPFTGNGATTAFPFSFKVFAATDATVTVANTQGNESVLAPGADYAVALNADQDAAPGGTVTLAAPLATDHRLAVTSAVPNLQPTDITNNGGFYPRVIEDALDRHVAQIQQIDEKVDRALKVAVTSPLGGQALPSPVAGMLIGWNESNDGLKNYAPIGGTLLGQQLAAANGSSLVGFQQAGAGAVVRTAQDKMREVICVDDFGADPTGATDSTTAIQSAFNAIKSRGGVLTFRDGGAYLVSGPFGTSTANTSDYASNVTIDGRGATLTVNATAWPVGNTPLITLEGNDVAVKNLHFVSTVAFEQYNTDPLSYRTRTIIGVVIGGKAASYNAMPDSLAYYKTGATVDRCSFTNIHSPIIATQSSAVKITNNRIYSYNTTAIVGWACPEDLEIAFNHIKLGADDGISVGQRKASESAWTTAGYESGNCRIHNNYIGYTRARCIGVGGYSNVIISNNECEKTLLSGIAIHGDPNVFATGPQYNRNIIIHNNTIRDAGRFYDTTSAVAYWRGPVSQENNAIGTFGYSGTRGVSVLPQEITISNNYIQNPSGAAFYLYMLDGVRVINNTATPGTLNQGAGNVNTSGSMITTVSVTGVLIQNNVFYPGQGVNWPYTYSISGTALTPGNMHIRGNYALNEETFDPTNETPSGGLIAYTCLDKNNRIGSGLQQPTHFYQQLHQPGADRLMLALSVQGATNGFSVKWDHAKLKTIVNMADLPTSATGLASGDLWNSGGTLRVV